MAPTANRHLVNAGGGGQHPHQRDDAFANEWFPAGEPNLAEPHLGCRGYQLRDLFEAQDLLVSPGESACWRHTVDTAEVAPIGNGNAQIVEGATVAVNRGHRECRTGLVYSSALPAGALPVGVP